MTTRYQFRDALVAALGEDFAYSYFDRSEFAEGARPVLYPWTHVAAERLAERAKHTLEREGVVLGPVRPNPLEKPPAGKGKR